MRLTLAILLIFFSLLAHSQLVEVPIAPSVNSQKKSKKVSARTQSLEAMPLPFWDDFSFRQDEYFPNDTLWEFGQRVWVSNGRAINPPSIFAATFDGLDSLGKPYNVNDVLAKGFADKLVSRKIRLDGLPVAQKDSVYLSFFYQATGHGESPDQDDNLSLWFKDLNGIWEKVHEIVNSVLLETDTFYYSIVKVDERFQHGNFQFRFQNFARLSGPYDTWSLDYVFLNTNRWITDNSFPDRTQVRPFTSILERYRAIPMNHFRDTAATVSIPPTALMGNLYSAQIEQPSAYYSYASITTWKNSSSANNAFLLEDSIILNPGLPYGEFKSVTLEKAIPPGSIDLTADSSNIHFKIWFVSGDGKEGNKVLKRFNPTDFHVNDTTEADFRLTDHYAYDDGTAEYGAGLNAQGDELAYGFPMFTKETDTLIAVDLYFPEFGSSTNRTVILKIWDAAIDGKPQTELFQQTITIQRTTFNKFIRVNIAPALLVKGKFFIGWQQTSIGIVPVGLDKNTDSGDDIYFNTGGIWQQNQNVRGSLMIRPIFGTGDTSPISGLEREVPSLYPNPTSGEFYIPGTATHISIRNVLGVNQLFAVELQESRTKIILSNSADQLLVIRYQAKGKQFTARVLVKN